MTDVSFVDESGATRLRGRLVPPPAAQPLRAIYSGFNGILINNGASANLPVDSLDDGAALLDLSVPAQPTFLTAGTFIVATDALQADAPPTAGGFYALSAVISDALGNTITSASCVVAAQQFPTLTLCAVAATPGAYLILSVANHDGVSARTFSVSSMTAVQLA